MATSTILSPAELLRLPTGIQWSSLGETPGSRATPDQNAAAILDVCQVATRMAQGRCGQSLQTAVRTEWAAAPGHRCGILPDGSGRFLASMSPILRVVDARVAASWPTGSPPAFGWTVVPSGMFFPEYTQMADEWDSAAPGSAAPGQNAIIIAGGYVSWCYGRMGSRVQVSYLNGWPNSTVTGDVTLGALTLTVDDVSGWAGVVGEIVDGVSSEQVRVTSVTAANVSTYGAEPIGPGTLTLEAPTLYAHTAGEVGQPLILTAMPGTARWGTALYAKAVGLERGATVVTGPAGRTSSSSGSGAARDEAIKEAARVLATYARTSF